MVILAFRTYSEILLNEAQSRKGLDLSRNDENIRYDTLNMKNVVDDAIQAMKSLALKSDAICFNIRHP